MFDAVSDVRLQHAPGPIGVTGERAFHQLGVLLSRRLIAEIGGDDLVADEPIEHVGVHLHHRRRATA